MGAWLSLTLAVPATSAETRRASGTFDVDLTPQPATGAGGEGATLGRMALDKQFHGDLEARSVGEVLTALAGVAGSAGYVAIERVSGTLHGRAGTFVLQHSSTMTRGAPQQSVSVVPDSGTGELAGLTGSMTIAIEDGVHGYVFDYSLEAPGEEAAVATESAPALPDPLAAGWRGESVCERLHEDASQRVLRCRFPPGGGHERHFHAPHFGYVLEGGRMRVTDGEGVREVDLRSGAVWTSEGVAWHEALNIGETTSSYLIVEPR